MRQLTVVLVAGARAGAELLKDAVPESDIVALEAGSPELLEAMVMADAVIGADLSADELAQARKLKLVQVLGAGFDGVEVAALPSGCALCNVFEHEVAIGEWVLMAMLALARGLIVFDRDLRRGRWHAAHRFEGVPPLDLRGRTVGVIGIGNIGSEVIRLTRAIGMDVVGVTRTPSSERERTLGLRWLGPVSSLQDLMCEADFAVLAVPLNAETRGIIGVPELKALGPRGCLINPSRGPLVEEDALYEALVNRAIGGAGLDVWYRYPAHGEETLPANRPFWELDNVVMTPHVSGFTRSTFDRRWGFIAEQVRRLTRGEPLQNVVNVGPAGS